MTGEEMLSDVLVMFTPPELRSILTHVYGRDFGRWLTPNTATHGEFYSSAAERIIQYGAHEQLFTTLATRRPVRANQIKEVARFFGCTVSSPLKDSSNEMDEKSRTGQKIE